MAECLAAEVIDAELLDGQSGRLQPRDKITLAVLADVIAHAEIFPAQRFGVQCRILVGLIHADHQRNQDNGEADRLEHAGDLAHRFAVVRDVFEDMRA